jgi:peptidoglycan-associated lipoprotein
MIQSTLMHSHRNFSLILFCAMLGACATTQRGSTGSGEQSAAPISEGTTAQVPVTTGDMPNAPVGGAAGTPPQPDVVTSAAQPKASPSTTRGSAESSATPTEIEEAAQLKRQLADQDAQINRLRTEQQVEADREEAEASKMREQQAAAGGTKEQQAAAAAAAAGAAGAAGAGASSGAAAQDEAAVFPANANVSQPAGTESAESAVQRAAEHSVYFGYDQVTVADDYDEMLEANAAYLKAHPALKAEIQGNCDERGSREYNLALGARRAMAVKRALELAGADGRRIDAISYGAEKPVANGKDEASYSQNRRADIVY